MAIANKNDLTHIVRTTQQWTTSYDSYECIPEGVLCVEFTPDGHVKAKIGNGHDIFSKLPYIGGADLTNYFTKNETVKCVEDIIKAKRFICIKGILQNKDQLPSHAECGDLYFVISQNQSSSNKYDEYVYSPSNTWENLGSIPIDIDLSEYAKIVYVDEKIDEVNERIDDIEQHGTHTHANKDILDLITAAFTAEEKDKLSTLYNYDDTELRELITQASHTHSNKDILDAISAAFTAEDRVKLDSLTPYDDTILKEKITALERLAHEHSNKRILDQTTASFTTEYERKMRWIRLYTGCTGMEEGIAGLVPAAQAGEEDYVLSGSGEWVPQTGGGGTYELPVASTSVLGGIKVGDGLEIDANGKLSVVGGGGGGDSIAEGDGITITTDPQTGVKTISVNAGTGLEIDPVTGELNVTGGGGEGNYSAGEAINIRNVSGNLPPGYVEVDYIEGNGNCYTVIDYIPNRKTKIVGSAALISTTNDPVLFGARTGSNGNQFVLWFNRYDSTQAKVGFVYGTNTWSTSTDCNDGRLIPYVVGEQFTFLLSLDDEFNINDTFVHNITENGAPADYLKLGIFALVDDSLGNIESDNQIFAGRMYEFKIYEDDVLVVELIPAVNSTTGSVGFYDTVNDKFYTSNRSTQFTYDPSTVHVSGKIIDVKYGDGLTVNQDNELEVSVGDGLQINQDGEVEIDPSIIPEILSYEGGTAISVVDNNNPYITKVRWTISNIRGTSDSWIQMRYFGFYNENQDRLVIQSGLGEWSDDSTVTYYQHRTLSAMINNQYEMTASSWDGTKSFILTFNLPTGTRLNDLKYFRYQTGDDETHRDPVSWEIHAYSEELDAWLLLNTETNATIPTGRDTWTDYFDLEYVSVKTIDAWNNGTDWDNFAYTSGSSDTTSGWNRCVHSPVSSIDTLFPVLSTKIKVIARDQNDGLLSVRIELHTSTGRHYGCYEYSQDEEIIDLKEFCELHSIDVPDYVSIGLCTLVNPNYVNISPSDVSRVDIIWYSDTISPTKDINVNYGNGLTVNQNNELEVDLGSGLQFDANGAIEVINGGDTVAEGNGISITTDQQTGEKVIAVDIGSGLAFDPQTGAINVTGGGDTVAQGNGINITTDQQTGVKTIGINVGDGLDIDPLTNELFVNGQLPEGTIIKKLTYIGNGSGTSNVIKFTKKPVGILSINGSSGTNYISAIPASINSEYLHGVYGGVSTNGNSCSCRMSYNDATNELTFTQAYSGNNDPGLIYNANDRTYTMQYLVKGHTGSGTSETNMVSVVKTFSYVGTGTSTNNIQFPETPDMLLSIAGIGGDNTYLTTTPTPMDASKLDFAISDGNNNNDVGGALMSFNDTTNVLTLTSSRYDSWVFNMSGETYQVRYIVNEVIASSIGGGTNYIPGEGIEFTELSSSVYADKVRMEITGIKSYSQQGPGAPYCQMRYFEFSDSNHTAYTVVSGTAIWSDGTTVEYPSASESIDVMINDIAKMCVEHFDGTKSLVLTFDLDSHVLYEDLQYFRYKTGADVPERDPISWKIYFNNVDSVNNWNLAGVVESATITNNREEWTQYFPLTVNEFNSVVISATGGSGSGDTVAEGNGISITTDQQTGEKVISVDIGSGLAFDPQTGAINVTVGGGDTVAEGAGIEITTDQQTGNKVIAINTGSGLQVNQTTNELEVSSGVVTSIAPTQNTPGSITVTEGDGTTTPVSVISQMGGATSSTAGTAGYVPAPAAGDDDAYLRGDGTWDDSVVTEDDELTLVFVPDDYQPS